MFSAIKEILKTLGGGIISPLVFAIVYLLQWVAFGKPRSELAFWNQTYFWIISYAATVALAAYNANRVKIAEELGEELIGRFNACTEEEELDAVLKIKVTYNIGYVQWQDSQVINYKITNKGQIPIERKLLFIGKTQGKERFGPFYRLRKPKAKAVIKEEHDGQPIDIIATTIPVEEQQGKLAIMVCFGAPIRKDETKEIEITIQRRRLWNKLRSKGSDIGTYTTGPTKPDELVIEACLLEDLPSSKVQLVPRGAENETYTQAAATGAWKIDSDKLAKNTAYNYTVHWIDRPRFVKRWYRCLRFLCSRDVSPDRHTKSLV